VAKKTHLLYREGENQQRYVVMVGTEEQCTKYMALLIEQNGDLGYHVVELHKFAYDDGPEW
jgi:hypothetical protein